MDITNIDLNIAQLNASLQIGDLAYTSNITAANVLEQPPVYIGKIVDINSSGVSVYGPAGVAEAGQFLSFSKDNTVNESSLKGYYASVTFKNDSNKYAELFAVGSEVAPSSK
tara:strand:+ start:700 stop:1035 length:336 start_codon:yes stop_codon:yes gene_type:complete